MAKRTLNVDHLQLRKNTTAGWNGTNPVLLNGEIGIEMDASGGVWVKVGDGQKAWSSLPYTNANKANLWNVTLTNELDLDANGQTLGSEPKSLHIGYRVYNPPRDFSGLTQYHFRDGTADLANGKKGYADVVARNFIGHLQGNADTATSATNDGNGNNIANTYAPKSSIPTALKCPASLTFAGAVSGTWDGSSAKTVTIPAIPTALKNPNVLKFTGASTASYDGSAAVTVNIPTTPDLSPYAKTASLAKVATSGNYSDLAGKPTIPTVPSALKNPNALTFTGAVTGSYDGSAAKTVNIPIGITVSDVFYVGKTQPTKVGPIWFKTT